VLTVVAIFAALVASVLALETGQLVWKLTVPIACAAALIGQGPRDRRHWRTIGPVVLAFAFAAVGDAFLSTRAGRVSWFIAGIAAYFVSHLGYLAYALRLGRLHWPTLALAASAFLAYTGLKLGAQVPEPTLRAAVVAYGLVSCVSLAAAVGLRQPALSKGLFIVGIGLLVFSDTLISFNEFLRYRAWNGWILPTYYLALLAIAGAVLTRRERGDASQPPGQQTPRPHPRR
jgi:hypothetical protein